MALLVEATHETWRHPSSRKGKKMPPLDPRAIGAARSSRTIQVDGQPNCIGGGFSFDCAAIDELCIGSSIVTSRTEKELLSSSSTLFSVPNTSFPP